MSSPFELTDEMIEALPPEQRGEWVAMLKQMRAQHALRDKLVAELVEARDYHGALGYYESQERAVALVSWAKQLTDDEVRDLLTEWWSTTEAWSAVEELREGMLALLRRVAPLYVFGERNHYGANIFKRPHTSEGLRIYRGNLGERPERGHSWTLDYDFAAKIAVMANSVRGQFLGMARQDGVPTVWSAVVDSAAVLGFFDDRDEAEVVVDPAHLVGVCMAGRAGR